MDGEQENLAILDQLLTEQGAPAEPAVVPPIVPVENADNISEISENAFIDADSLILPEDEETPSWLAGIETPPAESSIS